MDLAVNLIGTVPLFERLAGLLREQINTISQLVMADAGTVLPRQGAIP
jgi:hypothetical protein